MDIVGCIGMIRPVMSMFVYEEAQEYRANAYV